MFRRSLLSFSFAAITLALAACGSKSPISVTVSDGGISSVGVNSTVQFSATVSHTPNQTVTWAVVGSSADGTINPASGLYTAPSSVPNPPTVTVTATPEADSAIHGQASFSITNSISLSPPQATLAPLKTQQFTASAQGSLTWAVNNIAGGSMAVGTISSTGLFQAPESVPVDTSTSKATTVTISATTQGVSPVTASAVVTIQPNNQLGQSTPVALGTSGGSVTNENNVECESGTLGSLVTRNGTQFVLSNNHVLADSDAGSIGDAISQPGLIDAPSPCVAGSGTTTVAHLSQFITLEQPSGCTTKCAPPADAAIAQVVPNTVSNSGDILDLSETGDINTCCGPEAPASTILPVSSIVPNSTAVAKSGRTTGLTCSTVEAVNLTASIQYTKGIGGPKFTATYTNQIEVNGGSFSAAGDSGSLIVSQAGAQPVALLFGGNSSSTVGNPVATVLANLPDSSNITPTFVGPASRGPVAGCTSSGTDAFAAARQQAANQSAVPAPSASEMSHAEAVKNKYAANLMSDSAILAVGVARSLDRPRHAAVVLFVRKGEPLVRPVQLDLEGVLTRVVEVNSVSQAGILDQASTAKLVKHVSPPSATPTKEQLAAATAVKEKYEAALMKDSAVFGVGVTSSLDNPSEPAILVFVEQGKPHAPIPFELGGFRVRVKETDRFRSFGWGTSRKARPRKH